MRRNGCSTDPQTGVFKLLQLPCSVRNLIAGSHGLSGWSVLQCGHSFNKPLISAASRVSIDTLLCSSVLMDVSATIADSQILFKLGFKVVTRWWYNDGELEGTVRFNWMIFSSKSWRFFSSSCPRFMQVTITFEYNLKFKSSFWLLRNVFSV